ncbi:RNA polymerase sigma factor [Phenylobacterium sp.]|uniref:RNA polymerase sigma factor n=1 Tax=Phenylobacterium sp. TaxID=1871053 RepID=UPI00356AA977
MNVVKLFPAAADPAEDEAADGALPAPCDTAASPGRSAARQEKRRGPAEVASRRRAAAAPASPAEVLARAALRGTGRRLGGARLSPAAVIAQALDRPAHLEGFWAMWLAHQDVLRHRSFRLSGGNRANAEDALGNAMVRAAQAYLSQQVRNPRAWLLTILHNTCMDEHRRDASQTAIEDPAGETASPSPAWAGVALSPEEELSQAQMDQAWRRAMGALPGLLSHPLRLHLEGWSDDDIAERLEISREVVRKRRQLAKDRLRALLKL